ncbi:hypothetical protein [Thermoflexus sp.]|jgi:hypothetical protein|uniref:hypothetical protein n=1 Tax=Thermoflexus sp. TaxID=1969742 RepID=UPI003C0662FA
MWKLELACLGAAPAVACQRLAPVPIWWETGRPAAEECLRLRLNADEERAFDGYAIAARIGRAEWKGGEGIRFVGGCASLTLRNAERGQRMWTCGWRSSPDPNGESRLGRRLAEDEMGVDGADDLRGWGGGGWIELRRSSTFWPGSG